MGAAHDRMPWGNVRGEELLQRLAPANREALADVILRRKGYLEQAIAEIQVALDAEGIAIG